MFERYPPSSVRAAGAVWAEVLARLGLAVAGHVPEDDETEIPFSPLVKWLLNRAMIEADGLGHHRIRPEHLLLAVLEEPGYSASAIMRQVKLDREVLVRTATDDAKVNDSPFPMPKGHLYLTSRPEREKT